MLRIENDHLFKLQLLLCFSRISSQHKSLSKCARRYTLPAHSVAELLPICRVCQVKLYLVNGDVREDSCSLVPLSQFSRNFGGFSIITRSLSALPCLLLFTPVYFFLLIPFPSGRGNDPTLNKSLTFK